MSRLCAAAPRHPARHALATPCCQPRLVAGTPEAPAMHQPRFAQQDAPCCTCGWPRWWTACWRPQPRTGSRGGSAAQRRSRRSRSVAGGGGRRQVRRLQAPENGRRPLCLAGTLCPCLVWSHAPGHPQKSCLPGRTWVAQGKAMSTWQSSSQGLRRSPTYTAVSLCRERSPVPASWRQARGAQRAGGARGHRRREVAGLQAASATSPEGRRWQGCELSVHHPPRALHPSQAAQSSLTV